jgi:hypothetical protein
MKLVMCIMAREIISTANLKYLPNHSVYLYVYPFSLLGGSLKISVSLSDNGSSKIMPRQQIYTQQNNC